MNSSVYPLNVIGKGESTKQSLCYAGQIYLEVVILKALTAKMCLFFGIHTFEWIARYRKALILIWFLFLRKCAVINFSGKNVFIFLKSLNLNGDDNFFLNIFLDLIIISKLVDVHFWSWYQKLILGVGSSWCLAVISAFFPNERNLLCVHQHYSRAFIPEEVRQHHSLRTNSYHVDYLLLALTF